MIGTVLWFIMSTIMLLFGKISLDTYYIIVMLHLIYLDIRERKS